MKYTLPLVAFWLLLCTVCKGQTNSSVQPDNEYTINLGIADDKYFTAAYDEICGMLEGKNELSLKRAVFLVEWAYKGGELNYSMFCDSINATVEKLEAFIRMNNIESYRTAGNFALFEYFTKPNPLNGNKPFVYDFEDFNGDIDYGQTFVTKLMRTHKGQCTSLPLYYKILSDELGAESFLALAPHHIYIKHIDEYDRWVNIELTNGHFSTDAWMISSMSISAEAIKNKIFLNALNDTESVAMQLIHLANAYNKKYGYDNFTLNCSNSCLEYFPNYLSALFIKFNTLQKIGNTYIEKYGQTPSTFMDENYRQFKELQKTIENLGYREITRENYEKWVRTLDSEKDNMMNK